MTELEAMEARVSCRAYADRLLDEDQVHQLRFFLAQMNALSGLHFRLLVSREPGRPAVRLNPAMFSGPAYCCAALLGGEDDLSAEKVGYYGEQFVLRCTRMGLGTCWVGGTYDRESLDLRLDMGEKLWDVIPVGLPAPKVPARQRLIRAMLRRRDHRPEELVEADRPYADLPAWFRRSIEAVVAAPSAVNGQPVRFVLRDGVVRALVRGDNHGFALNDLGIAKYHFETTAHALGVVGSWCWGNGGDFALFSAPKG